MLRNTFDDQCMPRGAFVGRITLATVFLAHALSKPLMFTMPGTVAFFEQHGFPGWSAYPVFVAELVGGVLLLLGWRTRLVSAALLPVMAGAVMTHAPNGWLFSNPGGGWEFPALVMAALVAQSLLGAGAYSFDGWHALPSRNRSSSLRRASVSA